MTIHDKAIEAAAEALFNWRDPQGVILWGRERSILKARAAIAAYEAEKAKHHALDPDGWIPWAGGECPVANSTTVFVKFRDGEVIEGLAELFDWSPHLPGSIEGHDAVIAYRIVKP